MSKVAPCPRCETLPDASATEGLGAALAVAMSSAGRPDAVVLLDGALGAGKTTFAGGFLRALGAEGPFTSPTYAIVRTYAGARACHADVFRIETVAELEQTGLLDGIAHGVWLIEWASRFPGIWPEDRLEITLCTTIAGVDGGPREVSLVATGPTSAGVLALLPESLAQVPPARRTAGLA